MRVEYIGDATLYLGDALEIMPELVGIGAVLADPPYGNGYIHGGGRTVKGIGKGKYGSNFAGVKIFGNDQPFDTGPILALGLPTILWGANHFCGKLPGSKKWIVWDKRAKSCHSNSFSDCEIAWTNLPGVARMFRHHWDGMCKASETGIKRQHPTQKPIALMRFCLTFIPGDVTVLDPYMGGGDHGRSLRAGVPPVRRHRDRREIF